MATAIVYTHEPLEGPGTLEDALRRAGFTLDIRLREVRSGDEDAALVVVMGGPMGVYEADRHPYLTDELQVLERRLKLRRPNLGICLGAQLLAAAAGAKVYPGKAGMVIGVLPVTLTPEALADPMFASVDQRFDVVHWHGDTFDPVHGSVRLASTARYPEEAFRIGNSYGFQFHPEVTPAMLEAWARAAPEDLRRAGRSVDDLIARDLPRLRAAEHPLMLLVERLAGFFAREVGAGRGERFLFTVSGAMRLEGRGIVLSPGIPRRTPILRVGQSIILRRPDDSRIAGTVRGLAAFGDTATSIPLLVQLDDAGADIPPGTEAFTDAPFDPALDPGR